MASTITNTVNRTLFIIGNTSLSLALSIYLMVSPMPLAAKLLLIFLINTINIYISTTCPINRINGFKWTIFFIYSIISGTLLFAGFSAYSFYKQAPRTSSIIISTIKTHLAQRCIETNPQCGEPSGTAVLTKLLHIFMHAAQDRQPATALKQEIIFGHTINFYAWSDLSSFVYELFSQKIYMFETTNPQPYIIDCGSNIGMATLFFKMQYPNAQILAFEPGPTTFATLQKNITANHLTNVTAINKALLDRQGTIEFPQCDGALCNPCASVYADSAFAQQVSKFVTIPTDQLSHYIDRPVDFIKIDVEGAEGAIIKDLNANKKLPLVKAMVMEYHVRNTKPDESLGSILQTLEQNHFAVAIDGKINPPFNGQQKLLLVYAKQRAAR